MIKSLRSHKESNQLCYCRGFYQTNRVGLFTFDKHQVWRLKSKYMLLIINMFNVLRLGSNSYYRYSDLLTSWCDVRQRVVPGSGAVYESRRRLGCRSHARFIPFYYRVFADRSDCFHSYTTLAPLRPKSSTSAMWQQCFTCLCGNNVVVFKDGWPRFILIVAFSIGYWRKRRTNRLSRKGRSYRKWNMKKSIGFELEIIRTTQSGTEAINITNWATS